MIRVRLFCAFALYGLLATSGCQPIPTEPETVLDGLVYVNPSWDFKSVVPASSGVSMYQPLHHKEIPTMVYHL